MLKKGVQNLEKVCLSRPDPLKNQNFSVLGHFELKIEKIEKKNLFYVKKKHAKPFRCGFVLKQYFLSGVPLNLKQWYFASAGE